MARDPIEDLTILDELNDTKIKSHILVKGDTKGLSGSTVLVQ